MPFMCSTCQNEEYEENDGGFFCTECGTQSQEYFSQQVSDPASFDPGMARHALAEARVTEGVYKPKVSQGRPWTIYEAYQIIILAQADSLIAQGASKDVKDVVYTLWANYLSELGVAFCRKEHVVPEIVEKYKIGRVRELYRGTLQKPSNLKPQPLQKSKRRKAVKRKITDLQSAGEEEPTPEAEESKKEMEPVDSSQAVFLDAITPDLPQYKQIHNGVINSPQWMDMRKTVAFCYIGLMFTNPDILPFDVIRWIYDGHVPFLSASHLLPDDMVLSNHDTYLFQVEHFNTESLIYEVNKLRTFLDLTNLPRPDLTALTFRFIRDLCLPEELCLFVQRLIKRIPFKWNSRKRRYSRPELVALGYIVLALKVIFGLDDLSEKKLSEYSQELQALLKPDTRLFIWSEWKTFWMQREHHEFDAYRELTSDLSESKLDNLEQLLQCYKNSNRGKRRFSVKYSLTYLGRQVRDFDPEFRDALAKPLVSAIASSSYATNERVSSKDQCWRTQGEDFRESTVSHMVDLTYFQREVGSVDPDVKQRYQELSSHISDLKPKFLQYSSVGDPSQLDAARHRDYLWLLNLSSRVSDCQVLSLDKLVVILSDYFVQLSEGKTMEGVKCSFLGVQGHKSGSDTEDKDSEDEVDFESGHKSGSDKEDKDLILKSS